MSDPSREGLHHIGNSTHWIVFEGVKILIEPWLSEPAEGILSHRSIPVPFPTNPEVVLITHHHEDHYDPIALQRLDRSATIVALWGEVASGCRRLGFKDVRDARAGDRIEARGLAIDVVHAKHSCPEVCFRIERNGRAFFYGGDTMLTPEIEAMAREKPVRFAVLPGERSSLLGMRYVMTPEESIALAKRMGCERAVLTHFEQYVSHNFPFGWMVRFPEVDRSVFPEWFKVPSPGEFVAFPWQGGSPLSPRHAEVHA